MSTRLSENNKNQALSSIQTLLSSGVKFLDCPLTDEEIIELWPKLLDQEYVAALDTLKSKGISLDYVALDDDVKFYVHDENVVHCVQFVFDNRVLYKVPPSQIKAAPIFRFENGDFHNGGAGNPRRVLTRIEQKLTVGYDDLIQHMGREKFQEFRTWILACGTMFAEIGEANKVVADLFKMVKTSGQLKRMVPDLFTYIPKEQREAFDDQKRASAYPFEWAAYDRGAVDRMMTTLIKCHLLTGSEKPRNKNFHAGRLGHWGETRYGATIKQAKDE